MPKSRLEQNLNNLRNSLDVPQPIVVGEEAATESKAEVDQIQRIVQNTVSQQKPDIDWLAIASSLQQEIENTLNQINLIQKELSSARERVSESREALSLLQTPVKWMPVEGQFQLFDELQKVVDEQKDEQQRLEKLKQIEMAIASGDKLITQKEKQLALLQRELAELQESEEWCRTTHPTFADLKVLTAIAKIKKI
jgi:chromosome segregation ATPase